MSSDSDSDVCDFTSDINKQLSKSFHQFWKDFSNKTNDKETVAEESVDTEKDSGTQTEKTLTIISTDIGTTSKQSNSQPQLPMQGENVQLPDINAHNRIINKLNELTAEMHTILYDKYNKRKKPTKSKRTSRYHWQLKKPRRSNRTSISTVSVSASSSNVVLSSDDESLQTVSMIREEVNPMVSINILWKSVDKHSFQVNKYQTLNCISEHYCEKFNVHPKLLFFTLDDKYINLNENSFVSLRLNENQQIEGGVLPEAYLDNSQELKNLQYTDPLNFKVQCSDRKIKDITVSCKSDDKMEIIFWKVSRSLQQPVENIKLYFDGCLIKPSSKISELDVEDGDCFDLNIISK